MTRKSSGEFYAQIKAEAANPKGDIWWGGTGDPHLQAAEEGLTDPYVSPRLDELQDWAKNQAKAAKFRTVGVYAGALGYSYNATELAKRKLPEPKCWSDLTKPIYKDDVQVANPNSSGTSYTMLATLVQILGEQKAFDLMKAMHKNINQYTKSGAAPARAAATGESLIGITFQHDAVTQAVGGAPVKIVSPCEGTGYEIGSMSIIKGTKNLANARKWYDWALSPEAQAIGGAPVKIVSPCEGTGYEIGSMSIIKGAKNLANARKWYDRALSPEAQAIGSTLKISYQVPSNKKSPVPAQAPKLSEIKLIDYDFVKYGSSAERKRLLTKWDEEVSKLPK